MSLVSFLRSGGEIMWPLLLCSFVAWAVIFERLWRYRRVGRGLDRFHSDALTALLRGEHEGFRALCLSHPGVPTARLMSVALERMAAQDPKLRERWPEAVERRRQLVNQELRQGLWILGTIGSSAPFIGLFGTVVGILRSFKQIAETGAGGFAVVAGGISEALIATAAGIIVAVISVMAYNAFQTRCASLVLQVRLQTEELAEILQARQGSA